MGRPGVRRVGFGALAALVFSVPFWLDNPYYLHILIMAGIFAILALVTLIEAIRG